jgi:hypothetical protein
MPSFENQIASNVTMSQKSEQSFLFGSTHCFPRGSGDTKNGAYVSWGCQFQCFSPYFHKKCVLLCDQNPSFYFRAKIDQKILNTHFF